MAEGLPVPEGLPVAETGRVEDQQGQAVSRTGDVPGRDRPAAGPAISADPASGRSGRDVPVRMLDGGVSHRLVRRCLTAASILLIVAVSLLVVVAIAPWNAISALATVSSGILLLGSGLLLKRTVLWSAAARSAIPGPGQPFATATASIGQTRPMSPGLAGAPIKRRLKSSVVPIYSANGAAPGGGALVVHARADAAELKEGDSVRVWRAGTGGLVEVGDPSVGGRFVMSREADGTTFLATTRLTDTW